MSENESTNNEPRPVWPASAAEHPSGSMLVTFFCPHCAKTWAEHHLPADAADEMNGLDKKKCWHCDKLVLVEPV